MKRKVKYFIITIVSIGLGYSQTLSETMETMVKKNTQGYLGPMVTAFGMGLNSGTYHNAKPHKLLGFDFKLGVSMTTITDDGKTFDFVLPDADIPLSFTIDGATHPISVNPVDVYGSNRTSSTMFGDTTRNAIEVNTDAAIDIIAGQLATSTGFSEAEIKTMYNSEITSAIEDNIPTIYTPPGFNLPAVPMVVPQVSIGLIKDIELTFRGMPAVPIGDMGEFTFSGFGGKIGLNQFIPIPSIALPRIALGYYMTNLAVGDMIKMKNSIITLQASKSIPFLTVYGGFGLENSSLDISYTYIDGDDTMPINVPIKFTLEGENKFRTTIGARLKLAIITINADYNIGEFNTVNFGAGLTLR